MEKESVINQYVETRQKIIGLIELLPEKKWNEVFLGKWTLKDLVAHFIGWDVCGLKATNEILRSKLPSYYRYYDKNWAKINDTFVRHYKKGSKRNLLAKLKKSQNCLVKKLKAISAGFYNKDFGLCWHGFKITLALDTLFQAKDEEKHLKQIQRWLKIGRIAKKK